MIFGEAMRKRHCFMSVLSTLALGIGTVLLAPAGAAAPADPAAVSAGADRSAAVVTDRSAPSRSGPRPAALPPDYQFWNLQLNLCNSGFASCYRNGQAIPEAQTVISTWYPDVVSLNEVCLSDVQNRLFPTMSQIWSLDWTFYVFMPAWNVANNAPYQCSAGRGQYGNAVLGHVLAEDWAGMTPYGGIYQWQASNTNEWRSWACGAALGNYVACATHLASNNGDAAMLQCNELLRTRVPGVWTASGYRPTVVGGDFNLKYGGSPNIQNCVPSGWYRKGDGDVQHWFIRSELAFDFSRTIGMTYTDHPGWLVATIA